MKFHSRQIATEYGLEHRGEPASVTGVASLSGATTDDLAYATSYDDQQLVQQSDAGIVLAPPDLANATKDAATIVTDSPRLLYCKLTESFADSEGIHESAIVEEGATIGDGCSIGANVYIADYVTIGDNCVIQPGAVIGGDGLYFMRNEDGELLKHHQVGEIRIGDNVEIGSNTCIDRAMFDETIIKSGSKLDNFIHVAHDVHVGHDCYLPVGCSLSGHVVLEDRVRLQPEAAIASYCTVGEEAEVGMNSTVINDVDSHTLVVGSPAEPVGESSISQS